MTFVDDLASGQFLLSFPLIRKKKRKNKAENNIGVLALKFALKPYQPNGAKQSGYLRKS